MEDPQLSPAGDKVAAKMASRGTQRLVIFPLADVSKGAVIGLGNTDLNWWQWVNDEWLVAGVGDAVPVAGDRWYFKRALGISADGRAVRKLGWDKAGQIGDDVLWKARDGSPRLLLAMQQSIYLDEDYWPSVHEVDVSTGRMRQVEPPRAGVMDWYADASGTVRMGIGYDDAKREARLLYREGRDGSFRTVARASARRNETLLAPALFLAEPGKALAFDSSEGFRSLYEMDLTGLQRGRKLHAVEGHDLEGLVADPSGTALSGVTYTDDRQRTHWFDPKLSEVQAAIDKAVGDRQARIVSLSRDRTKLIVHVGGPSRPGAFFFFDTAVGRLQLIAAVNPLLKGAAFAPVKTIRYLARDGLSIGAVLTLPRSREAKRLPLIVMPHGGPAARDSEQWDWWAQFLADRGYTVIQPNYRGSTGFGEEFRAKGDGEWGLKMQDDLNDAVSHLEKEGIADPKRVCVVGGSYGGYAALRAAQRDSRLYRCAVSFAGVADLPHLARVDSRSLYGRSARAYLQQKAPDFRTVSPIHYPDQFGIPVLLVHGRNDLRVPVQQSREMVEKLRQAGKSVDYVEQPLGDHHFSREEDRVQFLKSLESFLAKHNPA